MLKMLPSQSLAIYQELTKSNPMTARMLGANLGILPQAAYRAIKPLEKLGVVEQFGRYPKKYRIHASEESLDSYLKNVQEQYVQTFISPLNGPKSIFQKLQVTFIQNREELL